MAKQHDKLFSPPSLALISSPMVGTQHSNRSPSQRLFVTRLARLLHLKDEWSGRVAAGDWRLRLINKAIYSTYCDCVEAGIADDARALVNQKRS